jgi:hypothetical protein
VFHLFDRHVLDGREASYLTVASTPRFHGLGNAARQRICLSIYMEIDDRAAFASLPFLDDLCEFATIVGRLADADASS